MFRSATCVLAFRLCCLAAAMMTSANAAPAAAAAPVAAPAALRAGAATTKITPPVGEEIIGGFSPFPSTEIHDDLHARCLVLDDGATRLALVVLDLLGTHRIVSDEARRLIQQETGIPSSHVQISSTHTHSASSALGKNRMQHDQTLDDYQRLVARRIADGVRQANASLRPAELAFGTAEAPEHVFNRRWYMKPGTVPENPFGTVDMVKMNPPGGSPNLVEPAGPTDPTISFLSVREPNGRPISLFAAYSLHYVGHVGPGHVSADYFAMFCERMATLLGATEQKPPFVAMLANGTSGDINNNNFVKPRPGKKPYEQMRYVADDVAQKVFDSLPKLTYRGDLRLDARYRELPLRWRKPTVEELAWARETLASERPKTVKADLPRIYAERTMRLAEYPEMASVPVQTLRIGDVCIGSMPCEVFCEIGLEFKSRSPMKPSFLVSLNHAYMGYLPTPRQHRLGGYETWIATNRLEREASDKMLAALLEMAAEMK